MPSPGAPAGKPTLFVISTNSLYVLHAGLLFQLARAKLPVAGVAQAGHNVANVV